MWVSPSCSNLRCWPLAMSLLVVGFIFSRNIAEASSSIPKGMILRIRLADGSMEKVSIPEGAEDTMTFGDLLKPFSVQEDDVTIQVGSTQIQDTSHLLSSVSVKHGSIIALQSKIPPTTTESRLSKRRPVDPYRWEPFPDLAKDYESALLKSKTKRATSKTMSYGAIAQLQSSLHVVEPQPEGPLKRVYMCRFSAERFHANGLVKKKKNPQDGGGVLSRVGLLLGTVHKERVDKTPRKARTSLSSQTADSAFCTVAKVQAVWEPSGQTNTQNGYDVSIAESLLSQNPKVLELSERLGLVPVGWIFSHPDPRHDQDDALPVFGLDVKVGASLQIQRMQSLGRVDGKPFVTLAMDANSGATEAFQLSDISVQMVHEGLFMVETSQDNQREIPTKNTIIIDGKETKTLDSVLCLVNTAMLSHEGDYAGRSGTSAVKKNGSLTNKTKKTILRVLDDDSELLAELCDFNLLLALDGRLTQDDMDNVCRSVQKWARGQKKGATVDPKIKLKLRGILET